MKYYVPLVLLIAILLSACSQPRPVNLNNVDSTKVQIVFAQLKGSESPFKTAVIDAIRIAYQDTAQIHVVSVKNTKDLSGVNADVLIVMDQLKAGLYMNKGLKTFFTAADKDQTLYLITTGDEKWRYEGEPLKLITAASRKESPERVIAFFTKHIDTLLD